MLLTAVVRQPGIVPLVLQIQVGVEGLVFLTDGIEVEEKEIDRHRGNANLWGRIHLRGRRRGGEQGEDGGEKTSHHDDRIGFGGGEDSAAWTADAIWLAHTLRYGFAEGVSGVKAGGNGSPRLATAARVVMNTHSSPSFSPTK